MMSQVERPTLRLKMELEVPDPEGPSKKFCVSRTLKARWKDNHQDLTQEVLNEIKNYKGSFIGDTVKSLHSMYVSEEKPINVEDANRTVDIARWAATLIEALIFSGIDDELYEEFVENQKIQEWDGTFKTIGPITQNEVKYANIEKVMLLLQPKVKHALFLISKTVNDKLCK